MRADRRRAAYLRRSVGGCAECFGPRCSFVQGDVEDRVGKGFDEALSLVECFACRWPWAVCVRDQAGDESRSLPGSA